MGVLTVHKEVTTSVPQSTLFKIFVLENHKFIPKLLPSSNVEVLQGSGGPGTIRKATFPPGSEFKYITTKVDSIDEQNFTHNYTIIDADQWMDVLEKATVEIKIEATPSGGSIIKNTTKFYPKGNAALNEEEIKAKYEKMTDMYKAVEANVLANPTACN